MVDVEPPASAQLAQILTPPPQVSPTTLAEPEATLLALTPAMERFLEMVVPADAGTQEKLDKLFDTFRHNAAYMIDYDGDATLTADRAFHQRRANCLAFSAMFIALAREAGLDAHFQEVAVPPSWDAQSDDTLVQFRHVNVSVKLDRGVNGVIDFRMDRYSETYPKRLMTDSEALAHYYSNISMQRLFDGQMAEAYVAAKRAIEADDNQSFIWNNMGIVQRHLGNLELAEASYRQALVIDSRDWSALNNLSYLYAQRGDVEEAQRLRARGDRIKLRNPYYRYALAQQAYRRGAYGEARIQLNVALGKKRSEPRFYYLRGLSLWHLGESGSAISDMKRAIKIATEDGRLALYQRQLEEWQDSQG
ncbi:MAG: tetratricopeptide repeat protein [Cellvibrionaceae bacterium]